MKQNNTAFAKTRLNANPDFKPGCNTIHCVDLTIQPNDKALG